MQNRIENVVELLADILGQEPQHEVAVFLKQGALTAVPRLGVVPGEWP